MKSVSEDKFKQNYQRRLKHLKLKGLQPKTIDAYSRAICRMGDYFDHQLDDLTEQGVDLIWNMILERGFNDGLRYASAILPHYVSSSSTTG